MIVTAPGKLLVTGAYAVLGGAPAVVLAVDRHAALDTETQLIDSRTMYDGDAKLGLGSSGACAVVREGARAALRGEDVGDPTVRARVFLAAKNAHASEQGGGSGVDVAASTFGGVLVYALGAGGPTHRTASLPAGLFFDAFWSGTSARTSDLRARVDALRARDPRAHSVRMEELGAAAHAGAAAVDAGEASALVVAARATLRALDALGRDADAPIVPAAFHEVARLAEQAGAAFLPSGAGGGDVGVYLGPSAPPSELSLRAVALGLRPLGLKVDFTGLRAEISRR
jgi:phosphomevalonate kinase